MGSDVEAGVQDDRSVVGRLLVPGDHDAGPNLRVRQVTEHLRDDALEQRVHVLVAETGGHRRCFGDPDRLGCLDGDVQTGHDDAPFQGPEMGFDPAQPGLLDGHVLLDLRPPQPEHPAQLVDGRVVVHQWPDLLQREAEVAQGDEAVQLP